MITRYRQKGFALPTILITSVVMMIVLISAVSAATGVNAALDDQLYKQLAREAAESGIVRAIDCLKSSSYTAQWTHSSPLYPASACTGSSSTCITGGTCLLLPSSSTRQSLYRSYFKVDPPQTYFQGDSQRVFSSGTVQLLRSDNSVYKSITVNASLRIGDSTSTDDVDLIMYGE